MAPTLIAAIVLGMLLSTTSPSPAVTTPAAAFGWLAAEAIVLLVITRLASRRIDSLSHGRPADQARARRLLYRSSRVSALSALLGFVWLLIGGGWLDFARHGMSPIGSSLLEEAAILGPFFLFQWMCWCGLSTGERAVEGPPLGNFPGNCLALLGRARQEWGLILPVLAVLLLAQDLVAYVRPSWSTDVMAQAALMTVMGIVVAAFSPHLLRLAWTTRPLPPGPLRDRLEAIARRHGFRFREILLWDTGFRMVNAVVTGILPWSRYILLSDAMIARLDEAEIEAIFGHEVGHVAHRHLAYLGFFAVATMAVVATGGEFLASSWTWAMPDGFFGEAIHGLVILALVGVFFFAAFGYLSRRFERQADLFGCRVASESAGVASDLDVSTFARALHLTAYFNGIDPDRHSWRHGSIRERVAFLTALASDPRAERNFQARIRLIRIVVAGLLLAGLATACLLLMNPPTG